MRRIARRTADELSWNLHENEGCGADMVLTIEPTNRWCKVGASEWIVWRGRTEGGIACLVVVCGMEVCDEKNRRAYESELRAMPSPHPVSLRQVLREMDNAS